MGQEAKPTIATLTSGRDIFIIPSGTGPYKKITGPLAQRVSQLLHRDVAMTDADDLQPKLQQSAIQVINQFALMDAIIVSNRDARDNTGFAMFVCLVSMGFVAMATGCVMAWQGGAMPIEQPSPHSVFVLGLICLLAFVTWLFLHEASHLIAARLFNLHPDAWGFYRSSKISLPLPFLDIRRAWALPPYQHAIIHLAGPICDVLFLVSVLTAIQFGMVSYPFGTGLFLLFGFCLLSNLNPLRQSDFLNVLRALKCDPSFGPYVPRLGQISKPHALSFAMSAFILAFAFICLTVFSLIQKGTAP